MPFSSGLSFTGIAKEVTPGTPIAATGFIPTTQFDPVDVQMFFDDEGLRGSMAAVYNEVAGPVYSTMDMAGGVFADTVGWPLAGILGDVATTGASAPFTHTMALKNSSDGQPTSYTLTDYYGSQAGSPARQYAGSKFTDFGLKFSADGLLLWTAKAVGFVSAVAAKPTVAVSAQPPLPAWVGTVNIAGGAKTFVESGEINFKRSGGPIHTVDGTAAPYKIWVGALEVSGKMTIVVEDEVEYGRYTGAAQAPAIMVFDWTTGTAAALVDVSVTMSKVQYTVVSYKRGKDYLEADIDFKGIANTTDVGASAGYSPAKVLVKNALAASTYV